MVETEGLMAANILGTSWHTEAVKGTPLGRIAKPSDVAKVAVFLASDDATWVSGEAILVAGGHR